MGWAKETLNIRPRQYRNTKFTLPTLTRLDGCITAVSPV